MPERKNSKNKGKPNYVFNGYANVPLDAARKQMYQEWEVSDEDVFGMLGDLIMADYRCGFSTTNGGKTAQFALSCRANGNPDLGYTMTSRAPTWFDALRVGVWKHYIVCEGDWSDWKATMHEEEWG